MKKKVTNVLLITFGLFTAWLGAVSAAEYDDSGFLILAFVGCGIFTWGFLQLTVGNDAPTSTSTQKGE